MAVAFAAIWPTVGFAQASGSVAPAAPATDAIAASQATAAPVASPCCHVAAGTVVQVELAETVSSHVSKRGDHFELRLAAPIIVDGRVLVPAGAKGSGEVVDAAGAGIAGRPAKLILAARYIDYQGIRTPLRAFRLSGEGQDRSKTAAILAAAPYVGLLSLAIPGGEVVYPIGTRAAAKVTAEVTLPGSDTPIPPDRTTNPVSDGPALK